MSDLLSGLHGDIDELAAHSSGNLDNLTPLRLQVAEDVALLVLLSDERLDACSGNALATETPDELSGQRRFHGVGLSMLQGIDFLLRNLACTTTQLSILRLLDVGQQLFLGLSALERTVLLGVHGQFEEFLVVLSIVPAILVHLLAETVEGVGDERVRVNVGKLAFLLLSQFDEFGSDGAGDLSALAENHAPDGIVHHDVAALALLDG